MEANVTSPVDNLPPFYEGVEGDLRGQGAAAARMRLFDELPSAGLGCETVCCVSLSIFSVRRIHMLTVACAGLAGGMRRIWMS